MPRSTPWSTDYFAGTREYLGLGALLSGPDYVQAQRVLRATQRSLAELFAHVDAVATPTATMVAPTYTVLEEQGFGALFERVHTQYWDAVGNPALAVPVGFNADGLPLSLQIAGRPFDEALLIRIGDAYQRRTDWHLHVPPTADIDAAHPAASEH
jgi:aspartyl-tRNA(Asn)/glutamyl-tRNA(Gln) amidotransferase subunit A